MARRRRIIIILSGQHRLTDIEGAEIGEIVISEPLLQETIEWDDEEISEENLSQSQVDCLNDAACQFPAE